MRKLTISIAISMLSIWPAWSQTADVPIPQERPESLKPVAQAATPAPPPAPKSVAPRQRGIATVAGTDQPTLDENTYQRMTAAMLSYSSIEVRGGWPAIPASAKLAPGAHGPQVATLRQRLAITVDLDAGKIEGDTYDQAVAAAVRHFQARHGLPETGIVNPKTLAEMNVPVSTRLRQLSRSRDRLAELQFKFAQRYVVVNIPAAVAEAVDGSKVVHRYVVVVGKVDRASPELATMITAINFNPTWTVPLSIVKKDIMTRMRKDPRYVSRMKMRLLDGSGNEIDPKSVDWRSDASPRFTVRQDAGSHNALGALRIDMPNAHAVYMHDTNHKNLFSADHRFQSSGCARVAEVRDLAAWLLADNKGWDRRKIDEAIATGESSTVRLAHKVPVAWVYLTGWVTRDDAVHFRDDIYHYDELPAKPQAQASARARATTASVSAVATPTPDPRKPAEHKPNLDAR